MTESKGQTLAVLFAEGYTGMTLMQELSGRTKELPFDHYLAIVDKERRAETNDILAMNPESFKVDHYDATHLNTIGQVLGKYKSDITALVLIPPAQKNKKECCKQVFSFVTNTDLELTRVKNFMLVSSISTPECAREQPYFAEFKELEDMCEESLPKECNYCIVRTGFYSQNLLLYTPQVQEDILPLPIGQAKLNMVDLADVGVVMVQLLVEMTTGQATSKESIGGEQIPSSAGGETAENRHSKHHRQIYNILGSELLNGDELAQLLSTVLHKTIKFRDISNNEAAKLLSLTNLIDPYEAQYLLAFYMLAKQGKLHAPMEAGASPSHNVYEQLTNMKPTTMEEFLNKYKQELLQPPHPSAFRKESIGRIEE